MNMISQQGLCIGCGICQAIAGADKIRVTKSKNGFERPVVVGELNQATVDNIFDICPGTQIEGLPESEISPATRHDPVWGPWQRIVRAYAGDPVVRHDGSTGGVLTALAQFLLRERWVDFVLHVKASAQHPTFGERHLSFTEADVLEAAGSRYGPSAPLIDIDAVLARGQPFAFVGKPCDIAALRNFARHDSRVNALVKYWLTPVCGGFMPPQSMDRFLTTIGIDPQSVTAFRYRGRGCPGPTRIETDDQVRELHYLDFWGEDESAWQLPFRCKICPDGIGEAADIAAADSWPGGSPDREISKTDLGTNGVIARTTAGAKLLAAAEAAGALKIERDIEIADMSLYQPHQVKKKRAVFDRMQGLGDSGRMVPTTKRLRIEALAAEMPDDFRQAQRRGVRARAEKANEAAPEAVEE